MQHYSYNIQRRQGGHKCGHSLILLSCLLHPHSTHFLDQGTPPPPPPPQAPPNTGPPSSAPPQNSSQPGSSGNGPSSLPGEAPKPTFPAYQQPQLSRGVASLPDIPIRPVPKVTPVGPGCKLIHPEDDLSLVSSHVITAVALLEANNKLAPC